MVEIEAQLRAYATAVLYRIEPVTADEVSRAGEAPARSRRRWGLVAAVVLVVVLAAVPAAWLAWRSSDSGVGSVTSGSQDRKGLPTNWTRIDALSDAKVNASASSPKGVVAVGRGIWFSRDAQTWTPVLDPAELDVSSSFQEGYISDVTAAGRGFVAAGQAVDPASGQAVAAIWTSPDGQHWSRVRDPALEPPTPFIPAQDSTPTRGSIQAVTRGGPGLIAVGRVFAGQFQGSTLVSRAYEPAIWTSSDATHWKRVNATKAFGKGPSSWTLTDVVAHRGAIIATASVGNATVIFESPDGAHWQRIATEPGVFAQVVSYRSQLVAVGTQNPLTPRSTGPARAAIWTSSDGRHWRQAAASAPAGMASYTSIATSGQSLVAVGIRGDYEPAVDGIMSVSNDGHSWQPVANTGTAFAPRTGLSAVAAFGTHFVAFGSETTQGQGTTVDPYRGRNNLFISTSPVAAPRDRGRA
ncbi:MAG: hypothetical protein M3046_15125 [Actinomycetota bacterium]|nr:hypothetical protein [Actinomycetota bacterium]